MLKNTEIMIAIVLVVSIFLCTSCIEVERCYTAKSRIIEAEQFIVKDKDGNLRAFFGVKDEDVILSIYGHSGRDKIALVSKGDQSLLIFEGKNNQRAIFGIDNDNSVLVLSKEREKNIVSLMSTPTGPIMIMSEDINNKPSITLISNKEFKTGLIIGDNRIKKRLEITLVEGEPIISIYDKNGKSKNLSFTSEEKPGLSDSSQKKNEVKKIMPSDENWQVIKRWKGNGTKKTETFTTKSKEWRIRWKCEIDQQLGTNVGVFQIYAYRVGDNVQFQIPEIVANTLTSSNDVSYVRTKPGPHYLNINAVMMNWEVIVEERR